MQSKRKGRTHNEAKQYVSNDFSWWERDASARTDHKSSKTCRFIWWQIPYHRFPFEQLCKQRHRHGRGFDTVRIHSSEQLRCSRSPLGLDAKNSGVYVLPPREKADANLDVYRGTADAISQNIDFIDTFSPEYLLILSGDHIYKMNYAKMLAYHKECNADATIAVIEVPLKEASRFGIMNTDETGRIYEFEEKPEHPKSTLASMGIYIFQLETVTQDADRGCKGSGFQPRFRKDIIPQLLADDKRLYAYKFKGYWKDVGTIDSLWEANMDLLDAHNELDLNDSSWKIYTEDATTLPHYVGPDAEIQRAFNYTGMYHQRNCQEFCSVYRSPDWRRRKDH